MAREVVLFALTALAAISMFTAMLAFDASTGAYVASGGGKWYYGPQKAQMEPAEACTYAGCSPLDPINVYTNKYGTMMSLCNCRGKLAGVPLVQTIYVAP